MAWRSGGLSVLVVWCVGCVGGLVAWSMLGVHCAQAVWWRLDGLVVWSCCGVLCCVLLCCVGPASSRLGLWGYHNINQLGRYCHGACATYLLTDTCVLMHSLVSYCTLLCCAVLHHAVLRCAALKFLVCVYTPCCCAGKPSAAPQIRALETGPVQLSGVDNKQLLYKEVSARHLIQVGGLGLAAPVGCCCCSVTAGLHGLIMWDDTCFCVHICTKSSMGWRW